MALPGNLSTTTQAHIDQLITDLIDEGSHLDFKRDWPTNWNESTKHELLADVTAFANAGGGDLIYGMDENGHGQAATIVPQVIPNVDQEVRRIQDFLLNLVEPRMQGVQIQMVPVTIGSVSGHVVVLRAPQSWISPHRVKTNNHFFVRDGARKRQLDVPEIRNSILRSESQTQRIKDFRTERLGKILSGEAAHPLVDAPALVVHLIPTQAVLGFLQIDPVPYTYQQFLPVLGTSSANARLNIDGALAVRNVTTELTTHGYSQFFRNGFFESIQTLPKPDLASFFNLASVGYEQNIINLLKNFRIELNRLAVNSECFVMVSLLRAHQVKLGVRNDWESFESHQLLFDRQTIVLPDVVAPSDSSAEHALKPAFDLLWQAAGFEGSRNYNTNGDWSPPI